MDAREYYYQALTNKQNRDARNPIIEAAAAGWKSGIDTTLKSRANANETAMKVGIQNAQKTKQTKEDFLKADWLKHEHFRMVDGEEVPLTSTENYTAFKAALRGEDLPGVSSRRVNDGMTSVFMQEGTSLTPIGKVPKGSRVTKTDKGTKESFTVEQKRNQVIGEIQQGGYTVGAGKNAVHTAIYSQEDARIRANMLGIGEDDPEVAQAIGNLPLQAQIDSEAAGAEGVGKHTKDAEWAPWNWGGKSAEEKNAEEIEAKKMEVAKRLRGKNIFNKKPIKDVRQYKHSAINKKTKVAIYSDDGKTWFDASGNKIQ